VEDIFTRESFKSIKPIEKGWSEDRKYRVDTGDGSRLLLRVSDISQYEKKTAEYELMERVAELGVPMSEPLEFGVCEDGKSVYLLLTWCDGEEAETALRSVSTDEQYALGVRAGQLLRLIHNLPAPDAGEEWSARFNRKTDLKIKKYRECGIRFAGDDKIIGYIEKNRGLLEGRPQCRQHGDYHVGNMIISQRGGLSIIDFNRTDFGDPWEEFNRIVWSAAVSPYFATGQINGYFEGKPPAEFFRLLAFYISGNTLSSVYWAIPFGQAEIDTMINQSQDVLGWFKGMASAVPEWYLGETGH